MANEFREEINRERVDAEPYERPLPRTNRDDIDDGVAEREADDRETAGEQRIRRRPERLVQRQHERPGVPADGERRAASEQPANPRQRRRLATQPIARQRTDQR